MLKVFCSILLLFFLGITAIGQCGAPPEEFYLVEKEDYKVHEELCFRLMNCLVLRPSEFTMEETGEAQAFCLIWLGGTPDYTVEVSTKSALFLDERPDYFYTYVFAMALVEKDFPQYSALQKEAEALNLLSQHEKSRFGENQLKIMKKVDKLYQKGKLESFLEKQKVKS
ncbi:MAG: hypothetical protein AB8B53_03275 [Flavobacteriales bacterium]